MANQKTSGSVFLVAADPNYRFPDTAQVVEGLGAIVYRVDDESFAASLVALFQAEHPEREFDLRIVRASVLNPHQLILANRELRRAEVIGNNLSSEDYRTSDPVFAAIGKCAIALEQLESELRSVLDDATGSVVPESCGNAYLATPALLQPVPKPQSLSEAFDRLTFVLERHRLLFLHFVVAVRRNPDSIGGPTGLYERVRPEELQGHQKYLDEIDPRGEFLFKNRWFLERYADKAISRFGPGEGHKPSVEGATHPYWSLDDIGAGYLQESADVIHTCAIWLREFGGNSDCNKLSEDCLTVACDREKSRWYSSIVTRWEYLAELDEVIAVVKRAAVLHHRPGSSPNEIPEANDAWFYLRVNYDEAMFNHAPSDLGVVVGDPDYFPVDSGTITFFKVRGEVLAQRLVRLFNRGVKPEVEEEGETRFRASFLCEAADSLDEDDIFLLEELLANTRAEVERLDLEWEIHTGPEKRSGKQSVQADNASRQRRPLSGDVLSPQRLFDQARRWCEKLTEGSKESSAQNDQSQPPEAESSEETKDEPASDETLRLVLPNAVMSAMGLRDLKRIRHFFPTAIPAEEAEAIQEQLRQSLESSAEICKLENVLKCGLDLANEGCGSDEAIGAIMALLAMHHPDGRVQVETAHERGEVMRAILDKCQQDVTEPLRGVLERIVNAMLYDCRIPTPEEDKSFDEPQRFLQMLRSYWGIVRSVVLHDSNAPAGYRPHPLMPLLVNLQARINACFERLTDLAGSNEAQGQVNGLIETLLNGDLDELQAVPEWNQNAIGEVDRFLEDARLSLGAKTYPLTPPEEVCLSVAAKTVQEYEEGLRRHWARIVRQTSATSDSTPEGKSPSTSDNAVDDTPPQEESPPFRGGTLVFFEDRVEFCGRVICKGPRSESRRRILNLLASKSGERYRAFSGEEIAKAVGVTGGARSVPGVIRELRDDFVELLRDLSVSAGRFDVIRSGSAGYHLAECISVQTIDPPAAPSNSAITDTVDVRNADVRNVRNPIDAPDPRIQWILRQLGNGVQLKGPDVVKEFKCSDKTALRLLGMLKDRGKIEFVGSPRTGYYRLRDSAGTDASSG